MSAQAYFHAPPAAMETPPARVELCSAVVLTSNRFMFHLASALLRQAGVSRVDYVTRTRELTSGWTSDESRLILVDGLPPADGGEDALVRIRGVRTANDPRLSRQPVIVITPPTGERGIVAARDAGATEILSLPVSSRALGQRIEAFANEPRSFIKAPRFAGHCRRRREAERARQALKRGRDVEEGRTTPGGAALAATFALVSELNGRDGALARRFRDNLRRFSSMADLDNGQDVEILNMHRGALTHLLAEERPDPRVAEAVAEELEGLVARRAGGATMATPDYAFV